MSNTTTEIDKPAIVGLKWECDHFGFPVAQLTRAQLTDDALAAALGLARERGIRLLVWAAPDGRRVPDTLLKEYDGTLVDRKATFHRLLQAEETGHDPAPADRCRVEPYGEPRPSPALDELAISAGVFSRFRVDRRLPQEKFESMYRRWIERSVSGELADAVLVATVADRDDAPQDSLAGMVTLSEAEGIGSIGLIAVAGAHRGLGIGSRLMHAAHQWMRDRDAHEATVVTQMANAPACRLYERFGYRVSRLQHYYHFWPPAGSRHA